MNIRNLLFTAMLFCAASIMHATPEANLTKQEQGKIKRWSELMIKTCPDNVQKALYTFVCAKKDLITSLLSKMRLGDSCENMRNSSQEAVQLFQRQMNGLLAKLVVDEHRYFFIMSMKGYEHLCASMISEFDITSDAVITEKHIVSMKKALAIELFTLECLSITQEQSSPKNTQAGSIWATLSNNPIKTAFGALCIGAVGYVLYQLCTK